MNDAKLADMVWAARQFGHVELGDVRRNRRLMRMAACACGRPSGKVAAVFTEKDEQQAAYDFLESDHVEVEAVVGGIAATTAESCRGKPYVYVAVDGTSVTVVDRKGEHDFGRIGSDDNGARGLKVIDALAVDSGGVPVGLLGLTWWARSEETSPRDTHARQARPVEEKETRFWMHTIQGASAALYEREVRGWFQLDREADGADVLLTLAKTGHWWTVRSNADRSIELEGGDRNRLRAELSRQPIAGTYDLDVVARPSKRKEVKARTARRARMLVRTAQVVLRLRDKRTSAITQLSVTAVWALEQGTTPAGEDPLDWLLFTNYPVTTFEDARKVVLGYAMRWRVEEFHKTWKSGETDVESTQLRSASAVKVWATILATVAVRLERLKRLAREHGQLPASVDLSIHEIKALKMLKFGNNPPKKQPTIAQAVAWIAELGGFASNSRKLPGATVLGRGLRYLKPAARLLEIQGDGAGE